MREVALVDQSPVSRTPRSNPALFVEIWDDIRGLLASTEVAKERGLKASHFSFNSGEGRCENCQGLGYEQVEMQFLADVYTTCPVCDGERFKPEVLAVKWGTFSVADILGLDATSALTVFAGYPKISRKLRLLEEVGLGYLTLGQPLNTVSGGESQRLKLVKYLGDLSDASSGTLLLLDEPTTGLHRVDVARLNGLLKRLVSAGYSVVVVEHQLDVIASADWVIEMGPEAGEQGGQVVFEGSPENLAKQLTGSVTGPFLAAHVAARISDQACAAPSAEVGSGLLSVAGPAPLAVPPRPACLKVIGARAHNLRNLTLEIPHHALTVVTGVSGSGKSSLAFDIVFGEGQRRFMESMSAYARQFVEQLPRAEVDALEGIAPTVAIEQRVTRGTRKSTVATVTEVAQYLRLLYARVGIQHSPTTGEPVVTATPAALSVQLEGRLAAIATPARATTSGSRPRLAAALVRNRKGHHQPLADWAADHGFQELRCDGRIVKTAAFRQLDRYREHTVEVLLPVPLAIEDLPPPTSSKKPPLGAASATAARKKVAAATVEAAPILDDPEPEPVPPEVRLREARAAVLKEALRLGKGACQLLDGQGRELGWFSTSRTDPATGEAFPELDPKDFSWNGARGWCPECRGQGQLEPWMVEDDAFPHLAGRKIPETIPCPTCHGTRLNRLSRAVRLPLRAEATGRLPTSSLARADSISLPELLALAPGDVLATLGLLDLDTRGQAIAAEVVPEVRERLAFLDRVGLGYLSLDRASNTLSGGEAQRIRLAAQLGTNLAGVLYVLDEPSIGLHARDSAALMDSLLALRDKGNTLLVVEHDADTMAQADHIIDLGPGAGINGGYILAEGPLETILANPASLTGKYLREPPQHPLRGHYRPLPASPTKSPRRGATKSTEPQWLILNGAALRNLRGGDLRLPLGRLCMVGGVSGAGKSTLIRDLLKPAVEAAIARQQPHLTPSSGRLNLPFGELLNGHVFRKVIEVEQDPIGKTPRSTPATYIGAFDLIRDIFASLPEAKLRGYSPGTFSFNTAGGRCEACKGAGRTKVEMPFLPDTYVACDACDGRRYGAEIEEIRWNDRSIADVLKMDFTEAAAFFSFNTRLREMLGLMVETGLGYLELGQSSPTLSGGEAQRLKLVSELIQGLPTFAEHWRGGFQPNLYILEEPTIGLHLADVERLAHLLQRLVDLGHTVIVIEHHLDLLAEADWFIEIGPHGGTAGGEILFQGPLSELAQAPLSPTAPFLLPHLGPSK